jgi:hypothetical protein
MRHCVAALALLVAYAQAASVAPSEVERSRRERDALQGRLGAARRDAAAAAGDSLLNARRELAELGRTPRPRPAPPVVPPPASPPRPVVSAPPVVPAPKVVVSEPHPPTKEDAQRAVAPAAQRAGSELAALARLQQRAAIYAQRAAQGAVAAARREVVWPTVPTRPVAPAAPSVRPDQASEEARRAAEELSRDPPCRTRRWRRGTR